MHVYVLLLCAWPVQFAALFGVKSMNEVYPIEKVSEAFDRMMSNKANFRVVVDWGKGK